MRNFCLQRSARQLGVDLQTHQITQLQDYAALVRKWNRAFNLVSRKDVARLEQRHILDSLAVRQWLNGADVLDIGSGAGLPGVPLAVCEPHRQFTLCERHARRARFLSQVALQLGLKNVTVAPLDVAALPREALFDTIVARAVAAPSEIWALASPRLNPGGNVLVFEHAQRAGNGAQGSAAHEARGTVESSASLQVVRHRVDIPDLPEPHSLLELRSR